MFQKFILEDETSTKKLVFNFKESENPELHCLKYGYNEKLNMYRNKIDNIDNENWKKVRWYINHYDFQVTDPIINRAFYKYWEIINEFNIFENYDNNDDIILHCAEAPGGFIQGSNIFLQHNTVTIKNKKNVPDENGFITITKKKRNIEPYKIFTISLNKDLLKYKNYNLPSYNKNILNKSLCVTYGKDNSGDINNFENIEYIKNISKKPFFLITADGGFDEGNDFNHKEQLHCNLILSEIYTALKLQKSDGHFILKVFDILTETSVHLLYLLSLSYKEVYIYKPKTSRPTNSEKYIICKYYKLSEEDKVKYLNHIIFLQQNIKKSKKKFIEFEIFETIPIDFQTQIYNFNNNLLNDQCNNLEKAIKLCNDNLFLQNYDNILNKSLEKRKNIFAKWCDKYKLYLSSSL